MLASADRLSQAYHDVADLLDEGWSGSYGQLAEAIGRSPKTGRSIGRLVKGYARRHADWPHERVYAKRTGRPAHTS